MHDDDDSALVYVPELHGCSTPPVHALPTGHGVHDAAPAAVLYEPSGQTEHVAALAPEYVPAKHCAMTPPVQELPATHGRQLAWPDCGWYDPSAHGVHTHMPVCAWNIVGGHATICPLLHWWPAGQAVQLDAPARLKKPALQATRAPAVHA